LDSVNDKDLVRVGLEQLQDAVVDGNAFVVPVPVCIAELCSPIGWHIDDGEVRQRFARRGSTKMFTSITMPLVL
jgi:hypothetical protein